jgi:hypothetical protein
MRKLLLIAALAIAGHAHGADVEARDAWIRLIPGGGPSAGYLTLHNRGGTPATLVGADCAAYGMVMLHRSVESGGTSRMHHVEGVRVAPGKPRALAPGGYHLMLMKPKDPPEVGEELEITLRFADDTRVTVPFAVKPPYYQGPK